MKNTINTKSILSIANLADQRVILRSCLNITLDQTGHPIDTTRIEESLKTILHLSKNSKKLIIIAHLDRPHGYVPSFSFEHNVYPILKQKLNSENIDIEFIVHMGDVSLLEQNITKSNNKKVLFVDNVRFFVDEDNSDHAKRAAFAQKLSSFADIFVNDAFADYRPSASTYDIAKILPSYLGFKMIEEIESLLKFTKPTSPSLAVLGGAKLSEKIDILLKLCDRVDRVIIGGAMAYTLLRANGYKIGKSKFEEDKLPVAKEILEKFGEKILLPVDHVVSSEFSAESNISNTDDQNIDEYMYAIDIGKKSIELFKHEILKARSILWNGPMGVFEWRIGETGTHEITSTIAKNKNAYSLVGGGDSITAINKFGISGFSHICTGGGGMLSFLSSDKFPTVDVILQS
jgi:3-phosphoglycerate kinase